MPSKPPTLSLRRYVPRKAWTPTKPSPRLRGRAGVKDRQRVLSEEPMCRICGTRNIVTAATIVDHIIPLSQGGSDERSNKQGLCEPCHDAKSKAERAAQRRDPSR